MASATLGMEAEKKKFRNTGTFVKESYLLSDITSFGTELLI